MVIDGLFFILIMVKHEAFSDLKIVYYRLWWITVWYFSFALVNIVYTIWGISCVTPATFG